MALTTKSRTPTRVAIDISCNDDPFYRYKIEPLVIEHSNQYGGVTKLLTYDKFCHALHADPITLKSWLQKKLGSPCKILKGNWLIQGNHDTLVLSKHIADYIDAYILCQDCWLPEICNNVCNACGKKVAKLK